MNGTDGLTRAGFLVALSASACATPGHADPDVPDWIGDFVELFYRRKDVRTAFEQYIAADYIQHSAGIGAGREAAIAVLAPMFARPQFSATPVRVVVQGNMAIVFLHVTVGADIQALVIDIFRFEGRRFVEHWDVKRDLAASEAVDFFTGLG